MDYFKVSALEMRALEEYCQQTQRTKTDILRELTVGCQLMPPYKMTIQSEKQVYKQIKLFN